MDVLSMISNSFRTKMHRVLSHMCYGNVSFYALPEPSAEVYKRRYENLL